MVNTQELPDPNTAKNSNTQKNKKKRYHVDTANNFIFYERFKLLVSEPNNYIAIHTVFIFGMVYFYVLTFYVGLIVCYINYFVIILHFIATCLLLILGFKNPGIVLKITEDFDNPSKIQLPFDRDSKPAVNQLAKSYGFTLKSHMIQLKFCPQCLIFRPPRTVHCWICNACISNMDHHCPFIGNCVGKGNYKIFFTFVCTLTIKMILAITQLIILIIKLIEQNSVNFFQKAQLYFSLILLLICFVVLCFVGSLTGFHIYLILNSLTTNQMCKNTWDTISGNPFKKFIRGPADQSIPHSHEHLHKTVVARQKDKSQQCMSQYTSDAQVGHKSSTIYNKASHIKSQFPEKSQTTNELFLSNTGQQILALNSDKPEI